MKKSAVLSLALGMTLFCSSFASASSVRCPKGSHSIYGLLNYSNCLEGFALDEALVGEDPKEHSFCIANVAAANDGVMSGKEYLEMILKNGSGYTEICATLDKDRRVATFVSWPTNIH